MLVLLLTVDNDKYVIKLMKFKQNTCNECILFTFVCASNKYLINTFYSFLKIEILTIWKSKNLLGKFGAIFSISKMFYSIHWMVSLEKDLKSRRVCRPHHK